MTTAESNAAAAEAPLTPRLYDVQAVRDQFPILQRRIGSRPLVYLDNASSTHRPLTVLDAERTFESTSYSNVHRGVHTLSQEATIAFEAARETVARVLGAPEARDVVFVRGTTEGVNLIAQAWGRANVGAGDNVVVSQMEHHSNLVPWQMLCREVGAELRMLPIDDRGELELERLDDLLDERTKAVAVVHISNVLGTVNPVSEVARRAHEVGAVVVVDGAQSLPHLPVDLSTLGADFYACSGHKCYGPSGIGVVWGRGELMEAMPPWQGGGSMIAQVSFEETTWAERPMKFEAGTPDITGAVGFAAALDFVHGLGLDQVAAHEHRLLERATAGLEDLPGVQVIGRAADKASVLSFTLDGVHPHDVGQLLDQAGVAVRAGHHCAQPVMARYGVPSTTRASFGIYNTLEEVDVFLEAVRSTIDFFG